MEDETALVPLWRDRLGRVFDVLERRRTEAMQQRIVTEEEFHWFIQSVAIPAFRLFRTALAAYGDYPVYAEGDDWVGFRWPDGHTLGISPLLRAPGRAAAALDIVRDFRNRIGMEKLDTLTDVMQDDVLLWLVRQYAGWKRVSEREIDL